jgi:hypothetical protein
VQFLTCNTAVLLAGILALFLGSEQNGSAQDSTSVYTFPVVAPIRILTVEREDEDGLIVTFSDGTTAGYVTEELLELRPFREPVNPDPHGAPRA